MQLSDRLCAEDISGANDGIRSSPRKGFPALLGWSTEYTALTWSHIIAVCTEPTRKWVQMIAIGNCSSFDTSTVHYKHYICQKPMQNSMGGVSAVVDRS